jgi:myo-inositol-1(or 4)-monophosphatase
MDPSTYAVADDLVDQLAGLARRAAQSAGRLLRDERPHELQVSAKSSPTDVVTQMDRAAEEHLTALILSERPGDGILGEEGGEREGTSEVRWIVDPLDGTTNYLYGLPLWSVSVGVEVSGTVVAGAVCAPELGLTYVARLGGGSQEESRHGSRDLRTSGATDLAHALLSTGFGYDSEQRRRQAQALVAVAPRVRDVRRLGSAAIDLCWVAAGFTDAYVESRLNPWDVAAGALIAREAGAVVVGDDDPVEAPFVMASAPGIADELSRLLVEAEQR